MTVVPQHMKSWPWMLVASKAAFLKNYLVISTWIFNGSSIECHENPSPKHKICHPFLELPLMPFFWILE